MTIALLVSTILCGVLSIIGTMAVWYVMCIETQHNNVFHDDEDDGTIE